MFNPKRLLTAALSLSLLTGCAGQLPAPIPATIPAPVSPSGAQQLPPPAPLADPVLELMQGLDAGGFALQALTPGYLERKIRTWLSTGQDARLVREIEYARLVHPQILIDIVQAHPELYGGDGSMPGISGVQAVSDYRGLSQDFDAYVAQLAGGFPPGPSVEPDALLVSHVEHVDGANLFGQPALHSDGSFVVAWFALRPTANDPDGPAHIMLQRYDSQQQPIGQAYRADTEAGYGGALPRIGMAADGSFVVSWIRNASQDHTLVARRFDAAGVPQGDLIEVGAVASDSYYADLSISPAGDFALVWTEINVGEDHLYVRRYNAAGEAQGSATIITSDADVSNTPNLARDGSGNLLVAWCESDGNSQDRRIMAQRVAANGDLQGAVQTLRTFVSDDSLTPPAIGMSSGGDIVAVWNEPVDDGYGMFVQRFTGPESTPQGSPLRFDNRSFAATTWPTLSMHSDGGFSVSWFGGPASQIDTQTYLRSFDASAQPTGAVRQLSSLPFASVLSHVTVNPASGQTLMAWTHFGPAGADLYLRRDD